MNNITYAFILSLIAGLSTIIGSFFIFIPISKNNTNRFISFCLSFSISIMIGISIFDLFPNAFLNLFNLYKYYSILLTIILFIISFVIIKIISNKISNYNSKLYKIGILSMIVLMIHNFPEGIITFLSSYQDKILGLKLTLAISMHNIPEGIAIAVPIYYSTKNKKKAFLYTLLSGLSEPLGALLAFIILSKYITNNMINIILIIVSFIMINLAIEQMLPEAIRYKENKYIIIGLITGGVFMIINVII